MTRRMTVTYAEQWSQRMRAEQHERDRMDPGCLEPCPYCTRPVCDPATCPQDPMKEGPP